VINADSAQVYRDLRILTARPSPADEARVPHRLFGYIDGAESCSAARWAADARAAIGEAHAAGRLPILTGGTGLYLRTLVDGIAPVPEIDPAIRAAVRALPVAEAHAALAREDPQAAARLRATDTTRVARALEVVRSTGRTLAAWQAERIGGIGAAVRLVPLILLPPRDWLRARCDARFVEMIAPRAADRPDSTQPATVEPSAIGEVRALLARHLDPGLPVMRAIGVAEIAALLAGEIDRETAIRRAQAATRQYAKRQYTWFAHQPPPEWPREISQLDNAKSADNVIKFLLRALTG